MSTICQKHYKTLEAYCFQDSQLLCINCILHDGHKGHQFHSIQDAVNMELELFCSNETQCSKNQQHLIKKLDTLNRYQEKLQSESEKQLIEITKFFNELKKVITSREQTLKQNLQTTIQKEMQLLKSISSKIQESLQSMSCYLGELSKIKSKLEFNEIDFLSCAQNRHLILKNTAQQLQIPEMSTKFEELNREGETNFIIKSLLNMKLGSVNTNVVRLKSGASTSTQTQKKQNNRTSFKESINFKKNQTHRMDKKYPLCESQSQNICIDTNAQMQKSQTVQINLQKNQENTQKINQNSIKLSKHSVDLNLLANYQEVRNLVKEKHADRSIDKKQESIEYPTSTTPSKRFGLQKLQHVASDISPQSVQKREKQAELEQYESFGQKMNDDSIKHDFRTFLHSLDQGSKSALDVSDSCVSRQDISHIYQQFNYYFVIIGNYGFVIQLYDQGGFVDSQKQIIEKYDPKNELCEEFDIIKNNRAKFGNALLLNGNVLIMGGKQDGMRINNCEEYCFRDKKFLPSSISLTSPRSGFGSVTSGELIYVIGGNDGQNIVSLVEAYNQVKQCWIKLSNMIEKRDELAVVLGLDNRIYSIGGSVGSTCLNSCERYDQCKNKWEPIASMAIARRALAAVSLPDGIYAIGGFNGTSYLSSVEKYDDQLNEWILIASLHQPRCTLSALITPDNQNIYVFGGFDNGPLDSVEKYSVLNDQWEIVTPMKAKRFMHTSFIAIK